jgi:hypothetical protein
VTSLPSAAEVCLAITRKLRRSRTGPEGTPLLAVYPELTADAVMGVVGPVLEARDKEIARLRRELRDENDRILELLGGRKSGSEEGQRL